MKKINNSVKMKMASEGKDGVPWNRLDVWMKREMFNFLKSLQMIVFFPFSFAVDYNSRTAPTFIGGR